MAPLVTDNNSPCRDDPEGGGGGGGNGDDSLPVAPVLIVNTSGSDSEGEDSTTELNGYVLLSQNETETDVDHHHHFTTHVTMEQEYLPWPEDEIDEQTTGDEFADFQEAGASETPRKAFATEEPSMDHEHIERIKSAMSGFTLPNAAFPSWAKVVPEEQWKDHLLGLMSHHRTEHDTRHTPRNREHVQPQLQATTSEEMK